MNMGVFPSGQWGQTVNLLLSASVVRIHPRPPRTPVSEPGTGVSVFICLAKGAQGWIRTAAEPTAACGGSREARLGQRSAFSKPCQGAAEKAASTTRKTRRTVRRGKKPLRGFFRCAARVIHPRPPKNLSVCKYAEVFVFPGLPLSRKKHLHFRHAVL